MKDLHEKREFQKQIENKQSEILYNFIKKRNDSFEFADISQQMAYDKNSEDLLILNNSISEWIGKLKPNDQRFKQFNDLLFCVWRIMSYCQNLETVSKTSVSHYVMTEKRNSELSNENRILNLKLIELEKKKNEEIDKLKKEIEFINGSK